MALSLTCSCGARFEVEDTFAGQEVSCPECDAAVRAPMPPRAPLRTSDLAILSTVLALLGAFTVIGTLAAMVLGSWAVVHILRHRDRLAGIGYALFGIIAGFAFTGLTLFAYTTGELFGAGEQLRKYQFSGKLEDPKDLEIVRPALGFSITRTSHEWQIAKPETAEELSFHRSKLLLVNPTLNAYVDVMVEDIPGQALSEYLDNLIRAYEHQARDTKPAKTFEDLSRVTDVRVRDRRVLPTSEGVEYGELLIDLRLLNQPFTFLIRIAKTGSRFYLASAHVERKRYPKIEGELRQILGSLRILDRRAR